MSGGKAAGCLGLFLFFLLETLVGFATGGVAFLLLRQLLLTLGVAPDNDFAMVCAVCVAILAALPPVMWIDRWCKHVTGESVVDTLPFIP